MKNNLEKKNLIDIATLHRGYDLPVDQIRKGEYPVIFSNGRIEYHDEYKVKGPCVVTGRSGTLGKIFYVERDFWPHNTTLFVSNFHDNYPKFIYYLLKTIDLTIYNAGTGVPTLNRNHIHNLEVKIPKNKEQRKIADILSVYDDLIEINVRKIKILEEIARLIYKEWFVKFKFPGYEKVKMVKSDGSALLTTGLGMLPEGWEVKRLSSIMKFTKGFEPGSKNYFEQEFPNSIRFIRVGDLVNSSKDFIWINEDISEIEVEEKDVLISLDGTIGKVDYGLSGAIASGIRKCSSNISKMYQYQLLKSPQLQGFLKGVSSGGTVLVHAGNHINNYFLSLSKNLWLEIEYSKFCDPLFEQCVNFKRQNNILRKTRDMLLPRLISGEIEV